MSQLDWADSIYAMEKKHADFAHQFSDREFRNKINILRIKDIYTYNQKELIEVLEEKVHI